MLFIYVLVATLLAGIGSVCLSALLMRAGMLQDIEPGGPRKLLSLAAGALLATAFMHLLPEAFESQAGARELFGTLLVSVVFFFLLDKAELWHHGHEHHHAAGPADGSPNAHAHGHRHEHGQGPHHAHAHAQTSAPIGRGGAWAVLVGDSVHCFGDGVLIASAFIADVRLGVLAALAVMAHEIPHHVGDLAVLRQGARQLSPAVLKLSMAGAVTALGGVVGFWLFTPLHDALPYLLVVASSSFIYVALADLIPQLQLRLSMRQTAVQVAWLLVGVLIVTVVGAIAHAH